MNLSYAKWLKLPIKNLEKPCQLFNVDGTENKAGMLKHYMDIEVQTGTSRNQLHFFLSDLGEHKAILGYSWFAAVQPKIDWKRGWIDSSQLPIIVMIHPNFSHPCQTPSSSPYPHLSDHYH